jgi:methionine sulfoxide reductase catalytic subunit
MLIRRKPGWWMPESAATPESVFLNRRAFMAASGVSIAGALLPAGIARAAGEDPTADLYPAARNTAFTLDREVTPEKYNLAFNNFYEFGSHKQIAKAAQALKIRPWEVKIDGEVEQEMTLDIDTLIRKMTLEERLYRHRCVEVWSMAVPWTGFPFARLVELARPLSGAKYVRMETFQDPAMAPGQKQGWYPWPYVEGLTIEEATNDLTFLVTGAYGEPVAKQMGAPLRLATPWKYGFKSIKSIVRFSFTSERPKSFWEEILPQEYGFWANVNPEVPHARWSQATEEVLGTGNRVPTQLYNGYAEQVAALYANLDGESLYM